MMQTQLGEWEQIWVVDFEFHQPPGYQPSPICLVAKEVRSGREIRLWGDELTSLPSPPYAIGAKSLFVAYYASAELTCHLALGWPMPAKVLDLYAEFRNVANGLEPVCGFGLLGALAWFGLDVLGALEKQVMRDLAIRGGPYSADERRALTDYCASDVDAVCRLLARMSVDIDLPRALLRGWYMAAAAKMEFRGVPMDVEAFTTLRGRWGNIQDRLVAHIDANYRVYEGRTFKRDRFEQWLERACIQWPRLPSGALDLCDDTFREMSKLHTAVAPLRELRHSLSAMRLSDLAVGPDGRNRCLLSAFRARTGRNQPSNSRSIFGPAVWLRFLIRPREGWGLAYLDWAQQEFGIAAALSDDPRMILAYESGDPYLEFAKQAGAAPPDATKKSHATLRERFKACVLAVQYAMGEEALGFRIGQPSVLARELLKLHRATYPRFWRWSDAAVDFAMLHNKLWTVFGWYVHVGPDCNPRFLRNFPMQGNGAEMLRLACCLATERGVAVCAPVHDAILIESPLAELDAAVEVAREAMADASAAVLDGFRLRIDAKVIRSPERFRDGRGTQMWTAVWEIISNLGIRPEAAGLEGR
jgi:DNA polymerase-1